SAGTQHRIRYFAADFNEPVLPPDTYDLVLFHQSAHHVAKLEKLYRAILLSMKAPALLYLDEYVGPSRADWDDRTMRPHRRIYASLPAAVRQLEDLPYPIQADDPSEAIRSSEIERQLRIGFRTVARRPYGGTLLSVLFPVLRSEALSDALVQRLIDEERRLLHDGAPSYYSVIVAEPRRGAAAAWANLHYFAVPKAKRLLGLGVAGRILRRAQRFVTKRVTAA
ncbi:MAG TPA: hypothetical protein VM779_02810, partial [Thermoanaerobaculia bacterium]|nr:hypothetical protein [Thermoanaerobaculia bacterium]